MLSVACARAWEAEAVEEGRLSSADRASFERHASTCATCAREAQALAHVRQALRQVARQPPDALALRRQRGALLHEAHLRHADRWNPRENAGALLVAGVLVILVVAWGIATHPRHAPLSVAPTTVSTAAAPEFDVIDIDHATVTSSIQGDITKATLADGVAGFHVAQVRAGHRFLVLLPDGEIEVRGTRFIVSVHAGRTVSVEVTQGLVALRLRDLNGERLLATGERWAISSFAQSTPAAPPPAPVAPGPKPPRADVRTHRPGVSRPLTNGDAVPANSRALADESISAAVSAFWEGRYAQADALLASFAGRFAGDPLCEDASFLRAMCHARTGDSNGAATLARAYLRSFPNGMRRPEAEHLAGVR